MANLSASEPRRCSMEPYFRIYQLKDPAPAYRARCQVNVHGHVELDYWEDDQKGSIFGNLNR
jgi:hypothetical protein